MVQRLEGEAAGHGAVTDHGEYLVALLLQVARHGEAYAGRYRGRGVADVEAVVRRLATLGKAADSAEGPQRAEAFLPAGKQLVGVGLVPHVPDDLVLWGVEDAVQRDGELDDAETWRNVAAVCGAGLYDAGTQLLGERLQLAQGKRFQLTGFSDAVEDTCHLRFPFHDVRGDGPQGLGAVVEDGERVERDLHQLLGARFRCLEPHEGGVGRLAAGLVAACVLA